MINDNDNDNDKLYLSRYTVYIIVKYIISIKNRQKQEIKNVHLHKKKLVSIIRFQDWIVTYQ